MCKAFVENHSKHMRRSSNTMKHVKTEQSVWSLCTLQVQGEMVR